MANDTPQETAPASGSPDRSPAFANAYAVSYRLMGDRDLATEAAANVAVRYSTRVAEPAQDWLPDVVHDAVVGSLDAAQTHTEAMDAAEDASTRAALRRRLSSADGATRVAVGLHHLAGYTVEDTATLMTYGPEAVAERCRAFDPPPGERWADLGDPLTRSAAPVRRKRGAGRRIPFFPVVVAVLALAIGVWAVTSIGERPTLDSRDAVGADGADGDRSDTEGAVGEDSTGTSFSASADPLPGAGCADPQRGGAEPGSSGVQELSVGETTASYRVSVPGGDAPAPLVISIPDTGQDPAAFQEASRLEEALPDAIHATLGYPAEGEPSVATAVVPAMVEDLFAVECVDLARVYTVGLGAGGRLAGDAVCESPELVVATAMVAGFREPGGCALDPLAAVLISARDDDPSVDSGTALGEVGASWAELVGADTDEVEGRDEETLVRTWQGPGGVRVRTVSATEGGHSWTASDTDDVVAFIAGTARRTT